MLKIAETGFQRSVRQHNCDLSVVCDWVEASLLADETEISPVHVCDILHEQQIYPKSKDTEAEEGADAHGRADQKDFCAEFMEAVWSEMGRRALLAGDECCYEIRESRLVRRCGWDECAAYAFLLILTCHEYYEPLRDLSDYVIQGELFEDFCCEALRKNGWQAARTGWASHKGAKKLPSTVQAVADALGETDIRDQAVKRAKKKNEAGCDMVSHWRYADDWTGRPTLLLQCASGADFEDKLGTPNIDQWRQFIGFSAIPLRGFCTPRSFQREEFLTHCQQVNGLLLERFRLLEPFASGSSQLSKELDKRLVEWTSPRIKALPKLR